MTPGPHPIDGATKTAMAQQQTEPSVAAAGTIDIYTERANLYPLTVEPVPETLHELTVRDGGRRRRRLSFEWPVRGVEIAASPALVNRALMRSIVGAFQAAGLKVSSDWQFVYDTRERRPDPEAGFLLPSHSYRVCVLNVGSDVYLTLNHHLSLKNVYHLARLRKLDDQFGLRPGQRVYVRDDNGAWTEGRFARESGGYCKVVVDDGEGGEVEVVQPPSLVLPRLDREEIIHLAERCGARASALERRLKQLSLLLTSEAAKARLQ
jgi:hypothetical protein